MLITIEFPSTSPLPTLTYEKVETNPWKRKVNMSEPMSPTWLPK